MIKTVRSLVALSVLRVPAFANSEEAPAPPPDRVEEIEEVIMNKDQRRESLPNGVPRYVRCYDNGGETADRYTVVFTGRYKQNNGGEFMYLGMSGNPFHPLELGSTEVLVHRLIIRLMDI